MTSNQSKSPIAQPGRGCLAMAVASAMWLATLPCQAAAVVGGSDLLNATSATQLEAWLGEGSIQLTNIFDKEHADTSMTFHAAVDGRGPTFSIIEVTGVGSTVLSTPVLIGGYNPQSWLLPLGTLDGWNYSPRDIFRTAFVFNLSQSRKFAQRQDMDTVNRGFFQTRNYWLLGPTFGAGYDLFVDQFLTTGGSYLFSYGADSDFGLDLATYPAGHFQNYRLGQIEVFAVSAVPEPGTHALLLAGLAGLGLAAKSRSRAGRLPHRNP